MNFRQRKWLFTNIGLSDMEKYSICLYKYSTPTQYKHGPLLH